ncbi:MAG: hypothetical protein OEQ25_12135 [Gammaproteobacteria bacterium]|nr:hypothetical protein [Gammaproteobacteria bacterium]
MHRSRTLSVVALLFIAQSAFAQKWVEFTSDVDRFAIEFPTGGPEIREIAYESEYGAVFPARVYSSEDERGRYSVTVVDYTDARRIHAERTNKTNADDGSLYWAVDVIGSIAYAAWNIRKRGGEITYDAFHYIQRVAGHQLQITNSDRSRTFVGIYLHETRLYIAEATVLPRSPPPVMFQQSLTLFNEEGDTFNYEYIHHPRLRIGGG